MAVGVNTCLRGFGCIWMQHLSPRLTERQMVYPRQTPIIAFSPTNTHARLTKPSQAKARHGSHGMAWFGTVCLCLSICVSFWRPFTPKCLHHFFFACWPGHIYFE